MIPTLELVQIKWLTTESDLVEPVIPADLTKAGPNAALSLESESLWMSFTNVDSAEQMRLGVNPHGAYRIQLMKDSVDKSVEDYELTSIVCGEKEAKTSECILLLPWDFLPANFSHLQVRVLNQKYPQVKRKHLFRLSTFTSP